MQDHRPLTMLLNEWRTGDDALLNRIIPEVYDELHRVAAGYMRRQPGHTLQATALINEAFCRIGDINVELNDRGHFIGIVANVMRRILVDHARAKKSQKRGSGVANLSIEDHDVATEAPSVDVLALDEVLRSLEKTDKRKVQIAELVYFCGATHAEAAQALDISISTLHREHAMLKALLAHSLSS